MKFSACATYMPLNLILERAKLIAGKKSNDSNKIYWGTWLKRDKCLVEKEYFVDVNEF